VIIFGHICSVCSQLPDRHFDFVPGPRLAVADPELGNGERKGRGFSLGGNFAPP